MTLSTPPELETLADFVRWAASRFEAAGLSYGHGTDNALDEAAALVLHTLHLPPDLHQAWFSCRLTAAEREAVMERVERRIEQRLPLPYITGEAWFAGLAFEVNRHVLVPRSPMAELIGAGFQPWVQPEAVSRIADVGTGSGCIAVACALAMPQAEVDAIDISDEALAVARRNIERHGVEDRVTARRSDLLTALPAEPRYQLIVSNPPYVDAEAMASLPPEYRHEPELGLTGGDDGLVLVRRLLREAADRLTADGVLVCEVGYSQPAFEAAFPRLPVTWVEFEHGGTGVFVVDAAALRAEFTA
jgi:ribosomal protein L3 glutamine methyltransferase